MYSHGSSARAGVGKRGHGGRNYRPPPDRKNQREGALVPPPLKACNCLIQLDLPEYLQEAAAIHEEDATTTTTTTSTTAASLNRRRMHWCFPGETLDDRRKCVQQLEKQIRSAFGVHLVIPGRLQRGPVAIAGKSYRDTIPATAWLLEKLVLTRDTNTGGDVAGPVGPVRGRLQRNVKDPNDIVLEGRWQQSPPPDGDDHLQPFWLFQSDTWAVMVCNLSASSSSEGDPPEANDDSVVLGNLQTCLDNLQFRLGSSGLQGIDFFLHALPAKETKPQSPQIQRPVWSMAFAAGHPNKVDVLFEEVRQVAI